MERRENLNREFDLRWLALKESTLIADSNNAEMQEVDILIVCQWTFSVVSDPMIDRCVIVVCTYCQ